MARQIASHWRDGYKSLIDRFEIGRTALSPKPFADLSDPIIRFAPRIDMFTDHRPCAFKSLSRDPNPRGHPLRDIDIQQGEFGQTLVEGLLGYLPCNFYRFGKILVTI